MEQDQKAAKTSDVVIVGGGIVGCTLAHALAQKGLKLILLEAGSVGQGISGNTFGWINATSKTNDETYFRLNADGVAMYRRMAEEWGAGLIGLHRSGMIDWAGAGDEPKIQSMRAALEQCRAWGYAAQALDRSQLQELEPSISFEEGALGYLASDDCWLDVPVFLRFLRDRLGAENVLLEHCAAIELIADEDARVRGVKTEHGRIDCGHVVIAAGANTPEVLSRMTGHEGFASRFPVHRAPGLLVDAPAAAGARVRHVVYSSGSAGLHLRDSGGGRLLAAADDTDGLISDGQSNPQLREASSRLLDRLRAILPDFTGSALLGQCRIAVGTRVVPADGRSIAGPALSAEGLWIVVTHSGVTLAPVLARLMAESIESGTVPDRLLPFSLDRFD